MKRPDRIGETEMIPLVRRIVKEYVWHRNVPSHVDPEDLEGYGLCGLVKGLKSYDPSRCRQSLRAYLFVKIRQAIADGLREHEDHLNRVHRLRVKRLEGIIAKFYAEHGRHATEAELAALYDAKDFAVTYRMACASSNVPTVSSVEFQNGDVPDSVMTDPKPQRFDVGLTGEEIREAMLAIGWNDTERLYVERYLLGGEDIEAVANATGYTESRISQIGAVVVMRLQRNVRLRRMVGIPDHDETTAERNGRAVRVALADFDRKNNRNYSSAAGHDAA